MGAKSSPSKRFTDCVEALVETRPSSERNMYSYVKELLMILGHPGRDIVVDRPLRGRGDTPDLSVNVHLPNGMTRENWIAVEVKDERGIFAAVQSREAVFADKSKYIELDTEWFLMIDPTVWVIRRMGRDKRGSPEDDIVLSFSGLTLNEFKEQNADLSIEGAEACKHLADFRSGATRIACLSLLPGGADARRNARLFYGALKKSFDRLHQGCDKALRELRAQFEDVKRLLEQCDRYGGLNMETLGCRGDVPPEHLQQMRQVTKELRRFREHAPNLFKTIVLFQRRLVPQYKEKAADYLVAETASLIISRVLMLRFMEDNGFFDQDGCRRYLCNGGIKVFSDFRSYFHKTYPELLKTAYSEGSKLFHPAFAESEFDWVFDSLNQELSDCIENVLYDLSFFDFATVREDILRGVYQKVIDPKLRKKLGQVYTQPQVARMVINRCLSLAPKGKFLDPACGTGTFIIEYFEAIWGEAIRNGSVRYSTVAERISDIAGNDINSIAASISQMQLMWRLMPFSKDLRSNGLPELLISGGFDSLPSYPDQLACPEFDSLENAGNYAVVAGNPPYVRPERQLTQEDFSDDTNYEDISINTNLYNLFIQKAMTRWLQQDGVLGFVLPLSFLDNADCGSLRKKFAPGGGQWAIVEIIDMEMIAREAFPDAHVNPIVLIAKKAPAQGDDEVLLTTAGRDTIVTNGDLIDFEFSKCTTERVRYSGIFTPDGRILTHLNNERLALIKRLSSFPTWSNIARLYWVKKIGSRIVDASLAKPTDSSCWANQIMISSGAAIRRKKYHIPGGHEVYKGENILPCQLVAPPVERDIDVSRMSDPSRWRHPLILPSRGLAFRQICRNLTACFFDPTRQVMLNSATVIFPETPYCSFPLDLLVLSTVYQWYFALSQREGVVSGLYAHVYPRTIYRLPWTEELRKYETELCALRREYLELCEGIHDATGKLTETLSSVSLERVEERAMRAGVGFKWGTSWEEDGWFTHQFEDGTCFSVNDKEIHVLLSIALPLSDIGTLDHDKVLSTKIPGDNEGVAVWCQAHEDSKNGVVLQERKDRLIHQLDLIVGGAFGLSGEETQWIRHDFETDALLKNLRPDEPFAQKQLRGFWSGLDSADRYK